MHSMINKHTPSHQGIAEILKEINLLQDMASCFSPGINSLIIFNKSASKNGITIYNRYLISAEHKDHTPEVGRKCNAPKH